MTTATSTRPYALTGDEAITDLWWPFGPVVGRYSIKAGADETGGLAHPAGRSRLPRRRNTAPHPS